MNKNRISSKPVKQKLEEENKARELSVATFKERYISCTIKGWYFFELNNALIDAINNNKPLGDCTGIPRTEALAIREAALYKKSAIDLFREANFTKKALMEDFKVLEEEIEAKLKDYTDGKIIRESYDEETRRPGAKRFFSPA